MTLSILLFIPEVWGTVSDWLMVGVTIVTAFYLYQTLKSQREVQQMQTELFKIESLRFKESIKPILKYTGTDQIMKPGDDDKKIFTVEVVNETDGVALEISKVVAENDHTQQIFVAMGYSDSRKFLSKGDQPLLFHFLIDTKKPASGHVNFVMQYQDLAKNRYRQRVFCICDDLGIEIHPSLPSVVND
jgi:hypothetical protein